MTLLPSIDKLKIKLFADGADLDEIREMARRPYIGGFTTNPTLMRKAGVSDYKVFSKSALKIVHDRPISFEVFADEFDEMERQAHEIASWGDNVYVKIPVTNTRSESAAPLVQRLSAAGIKCNVTAMLTLAQVRTMVEVLHPATPAVLSIFAGRIADTGRDPVPLMRDAVAIAAVRPKAEILWASPRELLNIFQADEIGCGIITATSDILKKLALVGKDLTDYSLETVQMFYSDAEAAGYEIETGPRVRPQREKLSA